MLSPRVVRALTRALGNPDIADRKARFRFRDAGHGYDPFGLHPDWVALADLVTSPLYERWFRVKTYGAEHLPGEGPVIVAANHSGTLPYDGAMLWADIYRHTDPPRAARAIADYFVPGLPLVGTTFARTGTVGGSRGNADALLRAGELLMLFPEGTPGIGKPYAERYHLQEWRAGHCELAIRHGAAVVPCAIIGPEEQMPQLTRLPGFGSVPYIPVPATPVPLPVRYHVHYAEALRFGDEFTVADADDPDIVAACAERVRSSVEALIVRGLDERKGIFR